MRSLVVEQKNTAAPAKGSGSKVALIVGALVVVGGGGAGASAWYMKNMSGGEDGGGSASDHAAAAKLPAQYFPLNPAFVVNLSDETGSRYLQIDVELVSRDPVVTDLLKQHAPLIRNRLLLMFGEKKANELNTREDKERLQAEALAETQKILLAETGKTGVEALIFTSFITQ